MDDREYAHPRDRDGHLTGPERELGSQFKGVLRGVVHYLQARQQLFSLEADEANRWLSRKLLRLAFAAFFFSLTYLLLLAGFIGFSMEKLSLTWWQLALELAVPHAVFGVIAFWLASRLRSGRLFEATRGEFEKDKKWLTKQSENP